MTVNADGPADMSDARRVVTIPELSAPSYLQAVLSVAYRDERNSVPLTVATPAGLVFGNAVHPATWLRRLGDQLRHLTVGHERNESAEAMAAMFFDMAEERDDAHPGGEVPVEDIRWVYFTDALIVPTAAAAPNYTEPACWQVAMRDVTGWTIGLPPG
ncbi:hypothetical protein [Pseudonocardia sp. HH130630-07]|uniref:hypothetical protein n=1 Tax=Pseudonocardia sp. HH130630-07 TaxID=1690815 RepID=UPI00081520AC|nr:hypothetical protein [Pseudonocardia sp. HH130630-07]ANY06962.1 hypothetical protein AFB00_12420 [Pseudonocardia sp. HH130630-07]